jgi:hypothetical protein
MTGPREDTSSPALDEAQPAATGLAQQRIRRKPASKRSAVTEYQARLLALLIDTLEAAAVRRFGAPTAERLPAERHEEFSALPEYRLFVEGAYACGFVCTDLDPGGPTIDSGERVEETVDRWSFFEVRRYMHTLLRSERWADGYSSPIFEALIQGVLRAIGHRLANDDALYEQL